MATPPRGYNTVNAYLTVRDVPALVKFVQQTFGAVLVRQVHHPSGHIGHTEVRIGDSLLMIGAPQVDSLIRSGEQPRPGTFYVYVPDVDRAYRAAMDCGANSWEAPVNMFYGDRVAAVVDTNDNVWWLATRTETLTHEEVQARATERWRNGSPV
ncbi:MAG: VOC family protein [Steroidobacteraceae bacterium]